MSDSDLIEYLFQGLKPEIAKMLISHAPRNLDSLIMFAKQIERGIEECYNVFAENKTHLDISTFIRDFKEVMEEISHELRNSDNHMYSNAAFRIGNDNSCQCSHTIRYDDNTQHNTAGSRRKLCYNCHQYGHYARSRPLFAIR
jgi:hypothetical protein